MTGFLNALLILCLFPLAGVFSYLAFLALFGLRVKRNVGGSNPVVRFAVLVPAHNEARVIGHLIRSIQSVNYDLQLLTLLVVADHCDDETVQIVRAHGVDCIQNLSGRRGKPAALSLGIGQLLESGAEWDVLCVFDADNVIHPDFFRHMAPRVAAATILQGNTRIHNACQTVFTRLNHINTSIVNRFKELARSQAGLTCRLRGHGMVFAKSMLGHMRCETASLVEDQDLLLRLVLEGEKVEWVHDAIVESIIPADFQEAKVQRQRWAGGKSVMVKQAVQSLMQRALRYRDPVALDLGMDFLIPSNAVLLALLLLLTPFALALNGFAGVAVWYLWLLAGVLLYFLSGCLLERVPARFLASVLLSPLLIFWRFWIYISSLKGAMKWR